MYRLVVLCQAVAAIKGALGDDELAATEAVPRSSLPVRTQIIENSYQNLPWRVSAEIMRMARIA